MSVVQSASADAAARVIKLGPVSGTNPAPLAYVAPKPAVAAESDHHHHDHDHEHHHHHHSAPATLYNADFYQRRKQAIAESNNLAIRLVVFLVNIVKPKLVVDFGCGFGQYVSQISGYADSTRPDMLKIPCRGYDNDLACLDHPCCAEIYHSDLTVEHQLVDRAFVANPENNCTGLCLRLFDDVPQNKWVSLARNLAKNCRTLIFGTDIQDNGRLEQVYQSLYAAGFSQQPQQTKMLNEHLNAGPEEYLPKIPRAAIVFQYTR